jgi:hypothetical protein
LVDATKVFSRSFCIGTACTAAAAAAAVTVAQAEQGTATHGEQSGLTCIMFGCAKLCDPQESVRRMGHQQESKTPPYLQRKLCDHSQAAKPNFGQ